MFYTYRLWLYELSKKNFILVILTNYFAEKTIQNCWEVVRYCKLVLQGEERSRISVLDLTFKIDWSANQKVNSWSSCHGDITTPWRGKMKTVVNWEHVIDSSESTDTQSESSVTVRPMVWATRTSSVDSVKRFSEVLPYIFTFNFTLIKNSLRWRQPTWRNSELT